MPLSCVHGRRKCNQPAWTEEEEIGAPCSRATVSSPSDSEVEWENKWFIKLELAMLRDGSGRKAGTLFGFGIKGARGLLHWASVAAAPDAPLSSRGATYVANLSAHLQEDHYLSCHILCSSSTPISQSVSPHNLLLHTQTDTREKLESEVTPLIRSSLPPIFFSSHSVSLSLCLRSKLGCRLDARQKRP